jgi:hypothetical protein
MSPMKMRTRDGRKWSKFRFKIHRELTHLSSFKKRRRSSNYPSKRRSLKSSKHLH